MLIEEFAINLVMLNNHTKFPVYIKSSDYVVIVQYFALSPYSGYQIAYFGDNDAISFSVLKMGKCFEFQLHHMSIELPISKIALDKTRMTLVIKGKIIDTANH